MDSEERTLRGVTAVVTGATKGVGRGVAHELAHCGARVFVTGRSAAAEEAHQGEMALIRCDRRNDDDVEAPFEQIARTAGTIDILVNSVWGGYEQMVDHGEFTWGKPFWDQPLWRWDASSQRACGRTTGRARSPRE